MSKTSFTLLAASLAILLLVATVGLPYANLDWTDKVSAQVYGGLETEKAPQFLADGSLPASRAIGAVTVASCPYYWRSTTGAFFRVPLITIPAGKSLRVTGIDSTGEYYQILPLGAPLRLWMQAACLRPNPDQYWFSQQLPTNVID